MGHIRRNEARQNVEARVGEAQAHRAAEERKQNAFDQQLFRQAGAIRARGEAQRDFLLPDRGPREEEIGDIRAGDSSTKATAPNKIRSAGFMSPTISSCSGFTTAPDAGVVLGILLRQTRRDRFHLRLRLRQSHARLSCARSLRGNDRRACVASSAGKASGTQTWSRQFPKAGRRTVLRQHPDDGVRLSPFSVSARPITPGSPPKRRFHRLSFKSTTFVPGLSSSGDESAAEDWLYA